MSLKREELVAKYNKAQEAIKKLESTKYDYKINRACDPFCRISNMSMETLVKAAASIHDNEKTINNVIASFGIKNDELESEKRLFLGFSVEDWDHDFKLRIEEIRNAKKLDNYRKAIKLISKNFSDDDQFLIDMSELDGLGVDF